MLSFEENGWNFKAFKILSVLNLLPIRIDLETGRIWRQRSQSRILAWKIYFAIAVPHCFYMLLRLVQSTMGVDEPEGSIFRWDHFIIHFAFTLAYSLFNLMGFRMFVANPEEVLMVFNQLFVEGENPVQKMMDKEFGNTVQNFKEPKTGEKLVKEVGSSSVGVSDPDSKGIRPLFSWPPRYSLDELLCRVLSFVVVVMMFPALIILAADPTRPQLLYSALPPKFQNVYSFLGLFSVEAVSLAVAAAFTFFSIVIQGLFFGRCQLELRKLNLQLRIFVEKFQVGSVQNRDMSKEIWILHKILGELRQLVLFIELFNRCFPFCIFAFKIICLFGPIVFYFFTIRHAQDFPLLGIFTGYIAISYTCVYAVLYQKAFSIPEKMEQVKREFLLAAQKTASISISTSTANFRAEMKREIGGIRDVGVKVGSFHVLERETTPRFVDFVLKNVVNLLVTFPR